MTLETVSPYDSQDVICIVVWHIKGGIVEPEKTVDVRQSLDKHVSAPMDTHEATIDLLRLCFYAVRAAAA